MEKNAFLGRAGAALRYLRDEAIDIGELHLAYLLDVAVYETMAPSEPTPQLRNWVEALKASAATATLGDEPENCDCSDPV